MSHSMVFKRWFTLIEMLIVIVIIGILVVALIPRVRGIQDRARYVKVEKDLKFFESNVFIAQLNTNKKLLDITGSFCTMCYSGCRTSLDSKTLSCSTSRLNTLRIIEDAAWMELGGLSSIEKDPWWNPYLLNENEGEGWACVHFDNIWTAGTDGLMSSGIVTEFSEPTKKIGDDYGISIRPRDCPGSY